MKNIHVLPTDEPSRLYTNMQGVLSKDELKMRLKNYNIYITNDEEIKEENLTKEIYVIDIQTNNIGKLTCKNRFFKGSSKLIEVEWKNKQNIWNCYHIREIILTTDQELIKDGVQAIDDDFLEWFVKNPSCEKVDVEFKEKYDEQVVLVTLANKLSPTTIKSNIKIHYKIIIPKEESKQTVQEYEQQGLEKYSYESEPKQETIYEYTENYKPSFVDLTDILPKQETLEEVADRLYPYEVGYGVFDRNCEIDIERQRFVEGAKCQQEISYSVEELDHLFSYIDSKSYHLNDDSMFIVKVSDIKKAFEQFKKK